MSRIDDLLTTALKNMDERPPEDSSSSVKKAYSEQMSKVVALAFADELRYRGMQGARPAGVGEVGGSGAERRLSGGIGAKKVDVTWATEESGLVLAYSVKTINFRDGRTKNYQKNLTNRRGDMLIEAVTLHRRFPYAVLAGFLFLDWGADSDHTGKRRSTWENAHARLRLFTNRSDPAGREEQFERLYLVLVDANKFTPRWRVTEVGAPGKTLDLDAVFMEIIALVAERNFDFYEAGDNGKITLISKRKTGAKPPALPDLEDEPEDDDDDNDEAEEDSEDDDEDDAT